MDTAAQERILSSLKAKGHNFTNYRDLYGYVDKLDLQTYHPVDYYDLPTEARALLKEDEVREVLEDVHAHLRQKWSTAKHSKTTSSYKS